MYKRGFLPKHIHWAPSEVGADWTLTNDGYKTGSLVSPAPIIPDSEKNHFRDPRWVTPNPNRAGFDRSYRDWDDEPEWVTVVMSSPYLRQLLVDVNLTSSVDVSREEVERAIEPDAVCRFVYVCMVLVICVYVCGCVCVCVYMYICMYVCMYICVCVVCMYIYIYMCVCMYVCMYVYIYDRVFYQSRKHRMESDKPE